MTRPAELDPGMLLFEVAAMLARHGIVASTANPTAAREAAAKLLHALGIVPAAPAAIAAEPAAERLYLNNVKPGIESTSVMPRVEPAATGDPRPGWNLSLPPSAGEHGLAPRRPHDRFSVGRASLAVVPDGGAS